MSEVPSRLEIEALVLGSMAGDGRAFERLVEIYYNRLRFYIKRLLGDLDRADDVAQQVWLAAYDGLGKLRSTKAFHVWLYQIATNLARREQRKMARERKMAYPLDALPEECAAVPQPDLSALDVEELHFALGQLSPPHREVLLLRFMEDLSYDEIAQVTSLSPGTVRSRLYYAKQALSVLLEGWRQ